MSEYGGGDDVDEGGSAIPPPRLTTLYLTIPPSYEPYEPEFEDEEPFSPHDPDDYEGAAQTPGAPGGTDDPDAQVPATNGVHGGRTVVEVNGEGGPQQQQVKKNAVVGMKDKKIPTEKRATTPYMTKYERARVLGTRALQIRYVGSLEWGGVNVLDEGMT